MSTIALPPQLLPNPSSMSASLYFTFEPAHIVNIVLQKDIVIELLDPEDNHRSLRNSRRLLLTPPAAVVCTAFPCDTEKDYFSLVCQL